MAKRHSKPEFPGCRLPKATLLRSSTPGQAESAGTWVGASCEVAQTQLFGAAPRIWRALSRSRVDHGRTSPAGLSSFIAPDPHAGSGGGCGLSPSIRRRNSAHSARGTATSASCRDVLEADPNCELTPNKTAPTRRAKIRYLLKQKGADSPEMLGFVEKDIDDILQLFHVFNEATHGTAGKHGFAKLQSIRQRVEGGIMFLAAVAL